MGLVSSVGEAVVSGGGGYRVWWLGVGGIGEEDYWLEAAKC